MNHLQNKFIVNLHPNSKYPVSKRWNKPPYETEITDVNYSILTGSINNLFVVDVDLLDNKTSPNHHWNNLIAIHGKPKTLTIRTRSGGLHYYFKYDKDIKSTIGLIVENENTHIDIINETSDNKPRMIVAPDSIVDGMKYTVIKNKPIATVPEWLKLFIMDNQKKNNNEKINNIINKKESLSKLDKIFYINDKDINVILNLLPSSWLDDVRRWSIVTNILKGLDKFNIWDEWSKKSYKYDKQANLIVWNNETPKYDINLLMDELAMKPYPHTKRYIPITNIMNIEETKQNERYVNLNSVLNVGWFKKCLIIKSDTGTGKTTSTFKLFKKNDYKHILSIVSRRSLVNQHIQSAKQQKINMYSYEDPLATKKNIVCYQLDSIMKFLDDKRRDNIEKYVIYMDEINSTLKYLINSSTMEKKRIEIFNTLNYIIKKACMVICSDADVSDLVFSYIAEFRKVNECLYVNNIYKNYNNINAYKITNVNKMVDILKNKILLNEGFVACFDQLKFLDQIYYNVYDEEKDNKFLKITSKDEDFTNTAIWENKFVFYTPKIIYGNDFVPNYKTDIFVFSKGGSIDSLQIVQQATRCRVIKNLYYYIAVKPRFIKYKNFDECVNIINNDKKTHYTILKELNCINYDEDARSHIKLNFYTKMFIYNEMVDDLLKSNYLFHFEEIIKNKGFIIKETPITVIIGLNKGMKDYADLKIEERKQLVKQAFLNNQCDVKYKQYIDLINNRINILKISKDELNEYIDLLIDDKHFNNHINISKLFRDSLSIHREYEGETTEQKLKSIYSKILLLNTLEKILNIGKFDFETNINIPDSELWTEELHRKYKNLFKNRSSFSRSEKELKKIRIILYKSFNKDIFIKYRHSRGNREYIYELNKNELMFHLNLFLKRQNEGLRNVDAYIISKFDIKVSDGFIDT
jgi:hypothetical protein